MDSVTANGSSQSSGQQNQPNQASQQQSGESSQNADFDSFVNEIRGGFESMGKEVQAARSEAQAAKDRISKIHSAFEGKEPQESEIDEIDAYTDEVLKAHLDGMQKDKHGIPLTAKTAVLIQKQHQMLKELQETIKELKGRTESLSDPVQEFNKRTYANIDSEIHRTVENIYGKPDSQIISVANAKIINEIKRLQSEKPDVWDAIRRQPELQRRLVMHHIEQIIPPKAREILQERKIQETPMTDADLWAAFREAGVKYKDNPKERQRLQTHIRQEIVGRRYGNPSR